MPKPKRQVYYCVACGRRNEWPLTGNKSIGRCEVCKSPDMVCYQISAADVAKAKITPAAS